MGKYRAKESTLAVQYLAKQLRRIGRNAVEAERGSSPGAISNIPLRATRRRARKTVMDFV